MQRTTRVGVAVLTLAMIGGLLVGSSLPASGRTGGGERVKAGAVQRLRTDAVGAVTVSIDRGTGYVGFVRVSRGGDLFPGSASVTPKGKARGFFSRYAALYGIQDAAAELREVSNVKDAYGFTHITYEQRYRGLPVFGGVIRAHLDRANRLTAVNGTFTPNVDLDVTPLLSASQAAQKAIAEVRANPPVMEENADDASAAAPVGLRAASTTLEVYRIGLVRNVPGSNQLVYEVEVTNGADVREFVFVHANAGKIVNRYSGVQSDLFRRLFEVDLEHQVWEEGDAFPGDLNVDQQHIVTFSGQAYYHFLHAFGRDSYDGLGHEMQSVNNDPRINCPNANWNGATTNYCTGVTADDVVAHEWGHAYTEFTHGLIYQWQSGALNESYSDIWGDVVDQINGAGTDTPGGGRTVERCSTFASNWPTVLINGTGPPPERCAAAPAAFGPAPTATGVTGDVVLANDGKGSPTDGCTSPNNAQALDGNIALVDRGTCGFTVKVANMQKVGATGVLVANNVFGGPAPMGGADPSIQIPSVMITLGQGAAFKNDLATGSVNVTIRARTGSQGSYRWLVGEDATAFGGAIRDMWDPTCLGDPGKVTDQEYFCASTDNGGVHSNSGIPNHGFALLVNGGTYNGHSVAAIGLAKAAAIYWRAQSAYQTPSTDFTDHAESLEQSCADLVGQKVSNLSTASTPNRGPRPTITAGDCASVAQMTQAVEFRNDPTEQCHFQPILRPGGEICGGQPATTVFSEDFESGLDGWDLTNQGLFDGWPDLDWTTDSSLPADRTGSAAFAADPDIGDCGAGDNDVSGMMSMQSPSIVVPGGTLQLSFTHYIASEQGFDGGNVWISVNGRAYTQIPSAAFLFNPYNQALVTAAGGNTNPMAGQPAFTGTDANKLVSSWGTSIIDLAATGARLRADDAVRFRFDFGMDGCAGIDGWYVDDVTVSACGAAATATKEESA